MRMNDAVVIQGPVRVGYDIVDAAMRFLRLRMVLFAAVHDRMCRQEYGWECA